MTKRKSHVQAVPEPSNDDAFPEDGEAEPIYSSSAAERETATRAMQAVIVAKDAAPVAPPVAPPRQAPRQPAQRRVSAEVVKAETKLLSLERRRQESLAHHDEVWASKRASLLLSFPGDVLAALEAMKVLSADEVAGVDPEPDGD
jgi:hypothetical protein